MRQDSKYFCKQSADKKKQLIYDHFKYNQVNDIDLKTKQSKRNLINFLYHMIIPKFYNYINLIMAKYDKLNNYYDNYDLTKLELLPFHLNEDNYFSTISSTSRNGLNKMYENLQYFTRQGRKLINQKNKVNKQPVKLESQDNKKTQLKRSFRINRENIHKEFNIYSKSIIRKTENYRQIERICQKSKDLLSSELFKCEQPAENRYFNLTSQKHLQKLETNQSTKQKSAKKYSKGRVSEDKRPKTSRLVIQEDKKTIQSIMIKRQSKNQILKTINIKSKQKRKLYWN